MVFEFVGPFLVKNGFLSASNGTSNGTGLLAIS